MQCLGTGLPLDLTGPHLGVTHDAPLWLNNRQRRDSLLENEYGLGDKGYEGCPEIITEWKGKEHELPKEKIIFNYTLQWYRGRGEHLVSEFKQKHKVFRERWRGQFATLVACCNACVHLNALQERMKGPRHDVFGPWSSFWELDGVSDQAHATAMQE